jgi:hypothetical protein
LVTFDERDHPLWAVVYAIAGATFGYVIYNTGLIFGWFKASTAGVFGCLQSLGTIGCGDTVSGFIFSGFGGMLVGLLLWTIRNTGKAAQKQIRDGRLHR